MYKLSFLNGMLRYAMLRGGIVELKDLQRVKAYADHRPINFVHLTIYLISFVNYQV